MPSSTVWYADPFWKASFILNNMWKCPAKHPGFQDTQVKQIPSKSKQADKQRNYRTNKHRKRTSEQASQASKQTSKQANEQANKRTNEQTNERTKIQANKNNQASKQLYTHTHMVSSGGGYRLSLPRCIRDDPRINWTRFRKGSRACGPSRATIFTRLQGLFILHDPSPILA